MKHHAAFWITLARSGLAVSLGLARISVVAGIVGIAAGALVLTRFFIVDVLGPQVVYVILGMLIGLIGLVHVLEGVRTGPDRLRQR
jgi:hypothetical protein